MKKKLQILILIDWFLPAYKAGGPITSIKNMIDNLAHSINFKIITSNYDYGNLKINVQTNKWLNNYNAKIIYLKKKSPFLPFKIAKLLSSTHYDLLIINGVYSPFFSILPVLLKRKQTKIVFPRGMLSKHSIQLKQTKKKLFISLAKKINLYKNTVFWTTNPQELKDIKQLFPKNNVELIPNFVTIPQWFKPCKKIPGELKLVTIARISPVKNILFGIEALNSTDLNGNITWNIYGTADSEKYLDKLKRTAKHLPKNIKVIFNNGLEPEKLKQTIAQHHFFFLPTKGENFGHAIFEAFASSRPVIISNKTPWKNLAQKNIGWDLELSTVKFKNAIKKALELNQKDFDYFCKSSYSFAKNYVINNNSEKKFLELINKLIL